jgi:hypothetical protein
MPSILRLGKITTAFDFDADLKRQLEDFVAERGSTLTRELHEAVRRHLAYPPPAGPVPLPDVQPARERKRVRKKTS